MRQSGAQFFGIIFRMRLRERHLCARKDLGGLALAVVFLGLGHIVLGFIVLGPVMAGARVAQAAEPATVTFSLDFPGSDPERYSITVQSDGSASYECTGKMSKDSDDSDNYQDKFKFSDATRARIFELAAQAHYFSGKVDSGNAKLASSGSKKLSYKDETRNFTAEYNYSAISAVQQLTSLFQGVSATMEFGRRLTYFHRYQKLALDEELKTMDQQAHEGNLVELQAVKPILQEIYDDPAVINVVRARAQSLMEMRGSGGH